MEEGIIHVQEDIPITMQLVVPHDKCPICGKSIVLEEPEEQGRAMCEDSHIFNKFEMEKVIP